MGKHFMSLLASSDPCPCSGKHSGQSSAMPSEWFLWLCCSAMVVITVSPSSPLLSCRACCAPPENAHEACPAICCCVTYMPTCMCMEHSSARACMLSQAIHTWVVLRILLCITHCFPQFTKYWTALLPSYELIWCFCPGIRMFPFTPERRD